MIKKHIGYNDNNINKMDINIIVDFLKEQSDRLFPLQRKHKVNKLYEISKYIGYNLSENITLEKLSNNFKFNIVTIDNHLNFNCNYYNEKFTQWIYLIINNDNIEILSNNQQFIFKNNLFKNINVTNNLDETDDDADYEEINTLDYKVSENISKMPILSVNASITNIIDKLESSDLQNEEKTIDESEEVLEENVSYDGNKKYIYDNIEFPKELILLDKSKLKKMLKGDIVKKLLENNKIDEKTLNKKFTKEKLIEIINSF